MKKYMILFLITTIIFSLPGDIHAQTTPTVLPTTTITSSKSNASLTEKINDLKDKIASRVAELNLVEKRGIIAKVTERSDTQITAVDLSGTTRSVDVDEITKFASTGESNFGISDIEKDDIVGIVGTYNKQSKRILARYVDITNLPLILNGIITSADEDEFTLTLITAEKKTYTIDIEKITKTNEYKIDDEITKSGFTDINAGERAIITGFADIDEKNRVTATRVLLFPEYPKNPKIEVDITPLPTKNLTPTPSSRSRITPTPTKSAPTPTRKPTN